MAPSRPRVVAVALAALVLFSTVVPAAGAAATTNETTVTEEVSVWEQAGVPLRVGGANAATTVTNPDVSVDTPQGDTPDIEKDMYVYGTEQTVQVDFRPRAGMEAAYQNEEAQLVVARLDADASAIQDRAEELNTEENRDEARNTDLNEISGIDELADIIREEVDTSNTESNAQDNVSIVDLQSDLTVSSSGDSNGDPGGVFETTYETTDGPGQYAVVAVTGQGLSLAGEDDESLALDGETTVIGADTFSVQSGPSDVTVDAETDTAPGRSGVLVSPGESVGFEVESDIPEANHSVVLYDAETYEEQTLELDLDDEPRDLQTDEVTIEHSLTRVEGTTDLDSELSLMGMDLGSSFTRFGFEIEPEMSGSVEVADAVDRALEEATDRTGTDFTAVETRAVGDETLRMAAAGETRVTDGTTLTLPTGEDWEGEYRWVHVVTDNDGDELRTNSGTVRVSDDTSPPNIDISPDDGETFEAGTEEITFRASYNEPESSIENVRLEFDGRDVTDAAQRITDSNARYVATGLENDSTYTFEAVVTSAAGLTAREQVSVSVNETGEDDDGGFGGGGGIGGGGGGGPALPPSGGGGGDGPVEADVESTPDGQGATVNIRSSTGEGGQFTADFTGTSVGEPGEDGVSLEGLSGTVSGDASITVSEGQEEGTPALSDDENSVVGYLNVQESGGTDASDVTFTFSVQASTLEQRGLAPGDVALYRYNDGWVELETSEGEQRNGAYRYEAQSPGFSTFAVARRGIAQQQQPDDGGEETTTTTTEPTTTEQETTQTDEQGGFGLAPLLIFLLLGGGGGGGYYAWRRGYLDDFLGEGAAGAGESGGPDDGGDGGSGPNDGGSGPEEGGAPGAEESGGADEGVDLFAEDADAGGPDEGNAAPDDGTDEPSGPNAGAEEPEAGADADSGPDAGADDADTEE
jgi:PGF-pre-PGF domain-containing protein